MSKKFLFIMLAIALAFGMMVSGCKEVDAEGFKDRSLNLKGAGGNSVTITVKGAAWKDFTGDNITDMGLQETFCSQFLEWTPAGDYIDGFTKMNKTFSLESNNKLKIVFSVYSVAGIGVTGSGKVKLQDLSTTALIGYLKAFTSNMDLTPDWAIGTNEAVTITIK